MSNARKLRAAHMYTISCRRLVLPGAVALALAALATGAQAQDATATAQVTTATEAAEATDTAAKSGAREAKSLDTVVVTGSHIRGTAQEAALPVDVITAEDLRRRGSPTMLELIKSLPVTGSVLGESNQTNTNLGAQARSGAGTINLRGLGPQRTLVLMNGKRFQYGQVDTNLLPQAAINRVEILKDGAAATYGSDAIAGVANFFTRTDLVGFDAALNHRFVDGSDGDSDLSLAYGWQGQSSNLLLSAGAQRRSELSVMDRDWSYLPRTVNPTSYSAYSNPGSFFPLFGTATLDANCADLGGEAVNTGNIPTCQFPFAPNLNLVEREERYQVYGEFNAYFSEDTSFHGEMLYAVNDTPDLRTSPGFPPFNGPTGPFTQFTAPITNPGAVTALQQAGYSPALIPFMSPIFLTYWRPIAMGGNPLAGGMGGTSTEREYKLFRASAGLEGSFTDDVQWEASVTYVRDTAFANTPDILTSRLQSALNGFGGANCSGTVAGANGCQYFNPFSNAVAYNPALGLTNPGYVSATANSLDLISWMFGSVAIKSESEYWVGDAAVTGKTGWDLSGGSVDFAVGVQVRRLDFESNPLNDASNYLIQPCPTPGQTNCAFPTGAFIFQGTTVPARLSEDVEAVYGELNLPFTDKFNVQAALRYESYGGQTGSTTNPKLAANWQATDWMSLRGSVGTTFRGPTPANRAPGGSTVVAFIGPAGGFRAVDNFGNPAVGPEEAFTYNVGALFRTDNFNASIDYWSYELEDQIVSVPAATIAGSMVLPTGFVDCSSALRDLVTFDNSNTCTQGTTRGANIARIRSDTTNGPTVNTSGVDVAMDYRFDDVMGGDLRLLANASFILEYDQEAFYYRDVLVSNAYDAKGFLNYERLPGTVSEWRGNLAAEYARDAHVLRASVNYIDGVVDDRGRVAVQTGGSVACSLANAGVVPGCQLSTADVDIDSFTTFDLNYLYTFSETLTFHAGVWNLFDTDPPQTRTSLSYDPAIASPYGRTFTIGVRAQF